MSATVVTYEPRGAAQALFKTRQSEVVIAGPAGTGKSLACLFRMHLVCLANPGVRCLIVRKTAVSLTSTTLVSFRKKVAAEALANGIVSWYGGSSQEAAGYKYSNGSEITVGGMDKPEKVLSSEYDMIFCDEATELTVTDWETLGTRLRNGRLAWQQQMAACNPVHPTHWIKQRAATPAMVMLHSRHEDNPAYVNRDGTLTPAGRDYLGRLDNLTGVRKLRLRDGIWAAAEGVIYEAFDEGIHVVPRFEIPMAWPRYWAVDFGFTNPFVLQCWAEDPDGRVYLYREIYRTRTLVEDHARAILALVTDANGRWLEPRPQRVICDHDAEDRATLERHLRLPTTAARKNVSEGLQATQSRFKVQPDGKPRILFFADALTSVDQALLDSKRPTSTLEELPGYVWDVAEGRKPKDAPVKEDDHGSDAMRYLIADRDLGLRPRYRSFAT